MTPRFSSKVTGSCHCQRVQFTVEISVYEAVRCNCSICTMKGYLHYFALPSAFEIIQGQEELTTYRFGTQTAAHTFCKQCGVAPFYSPRSHPGQIDVNVNCLPRDIIDTFTITDFDGENWSENIHQLRGVPSTIV